MTELNLFNHPMRRVLADPVFGWPLFPGESAGGESGSPPNSPTGRPRISAMPGPSS